MKDIKKSKRGVFFTIDAILATGILLLVILLISKSYVSESEKTQTKLMSQDFIMLFTNIKVEELENSYAQSLIESGDISNGNNTVLEQIAEFWAEGKTSLAQNFSKNITDMMIPARFGFGIYVDEEEIYARSQSIKDSLVSSRKIISGIAKEKPTEGFTSRAVLGKITSKTNTKVYPFDVIAPCYNSPGNSSNADKITIEYYITLPSDANITNATWKIVPAIAGTSVTAYINGNRVLNGIPGVNSIINAQGNFTNGSNTVRYEQTVSSNGGCAGDDGTTHNIITYKTQQAQTLDNKTSFPFAVVAADGRISDYEKPIFSPNTDINKINISINTNSSEVKLTFRLKNNEFIIGTKTTVKSHVFWTNNEIQGNLTQNGISYNDLADTYFYLIFDFIPKSGSNVTILPNSTVNIEGSKGDVSFGAIDVSQKIDLGLQNNATGWGWCPNSYRDVQWNFTVPDDSVHSYADWIIGWCWGDDADQIAKANNVKLYNHIEGSAGTDPFIEAFARFGYTKDVAAGSVVTGKNWFSLKFGSDYSTRPEVSYGENTFLIPNSVAYTSVLQEADGCLWKVEVQGGAKKNIKVPKSYSGAENCAYNTSAIVYNGNDSFHAVAFEIFKLLDFDDDGDVDVLVSDGDLQIETNVISKVPSLWGPAIVEVRVWE